MQERHIEELSKNQMFGTKDQYESNDFAAQIAIQTTNLPEGSRTPTNDEVMAMKQFSADYYAKKQNASQREVRRAMQRKFKITVLKNTSENE